MYIANGQDPEHGEGPGHLWCIDITKTGDVSAELPAEAEAAPPAQPNEEMLDAVAAAGKSRKGKPNPNSAVVWSFERLPAADKLAKAGKRVKSSQRMNRTISTVAVQDGLAFVPDFSGIFHCFDAKTGEHLWLYNMNSAVWGSPMIADGKVYQCTENGDVLIFPVARELKEDAILTRNMGSASFCSPVYANGTLYIMTREKLFAISEKK
jgi:outer membrane protein assembly factor BamB